MNIKIAELDTHLTFQERVVTTDANFQPSTSFTDVFHAWASVEPRGGVRFTKFSNPEPSATHIMIVYYDSRIVEGLRISDHNGDQYKIIAINKQTSGRTHYLQLDVEQEKVRV